jgi:hypothetical protein
MHVMTHESAAAQDIRDAFETMANPGLMHCPGVPPCTTFRTTRLPNRRCMIAGLTPATRSATLLLTLINARVITAAQTCPLGLPITTQVGTGHSKAYGKAAGGAVIDLGGRFSANLNAESAFARESGNLFAVTVGLRSGGGGCHEFTPQR